MIIFVNGEQRDVPAPATLAEVVGLGPSTPRGFAVAVDGSVVPRGQHGSTTLAEGARVEIVTAVQGG